MNIPDHVEYVIRPLARTGDEAARIGVAAINAAGFPVLRTRTVLIKHGTHPDDVAEAIGRQLAMLHQEVKWERIEALKAENTP